ERPGSVVTGLAGRERVAGGGPEAEDEGVGELPVLEAARTVGQAEGVRVDPVGAAHVEKQGEDTALEQPVGHVQEADAPRAPQELAPGGGEEIASERGDVDRHLSHRLTGVD